MKYKVVAIGEMLWDVFKGEKKPGGSSMNVSLHLHKQGIVTEFISAVGEDAYGKELLGFLESQQHSLRLIQTHPTLPTSTVEVHLDDQNQATYTIVAPVAWDAIALTEQAILELKSADAFVYCSLTCRNEKSRATILELLKHAKFKVFDINLRPPFYEIGTLKLLLAEADVLKINEDELAYLCTELALNSTDLKQACLEISKMFAIGTICITLGDKGAMVWQEGEVFRHEGYKVEVGDTVGAGDSFLATYISSILQGYTVEASLDRACTVGAFVASQQGANPEYDNSVYTLYH